MNKVRLLTLTFFDAKKGHDLVAKGSDK